MDKSRVLKDATSRNNMLLTLRKWILPLRTSRDSKTLEGKLRGDQKKERNYIRDTTLESTNHFTATSKPWRMTLVVFKHWKMVIIWSLTTKERLNCSTPNWCLFSPIKPLMMFLVHHPGSWYSKYSWYRDTWRGSAKASWRPRTQ